MVAPAYEQNRRIRSGCGGVRTFSPSRGTAVAIGGPASTGAAARGGEQRIRVSCGVGRRPLFALALLLAFPFLLLLFVLAFALALAALLQVARRLRALGARRVAGQEAEQRGEVRLRGGGRGGGCRTLLERGGDGEVAHPVFSAPATRTADRHRLAEFQWRDVEEERIATCERNNHGGAPHNTQPSNANTKRNEASKQPREETERETR